MFPGLRRRTQMGGSVFFRGTLPVRPEEVLGPLHGIDHELQPPAEGDAWAATLRHPQWGEAEVACPRQPAVPPRFLLDVDPRLEPAEIDAVAASRSQLMVRMDLPEGDVLQTRKRFFRILHALMGDAADGGVAACDHVSQRFWPRNPLEDELAHDADLDVEALYCLHAIYLDDPDAPPRGEDTPPPTTWLHTHGLGELGFLDFDVLRPHPANPWIATDFARALAFSLIEGAIQVGRPADLAQPAGGVELVDAATFDRRASRDAAAIREPDEHHTPRRVVVCEPRRRLLGLPVGPVRPARWLQRPAPDEMVFQFTHTATDLMARRARQTYAVLRRFAEEFADLQLPCLVKLGYRVAGGEPHEREHLWFEVHALEDDTVDATLLNQPFQVPELRPGQRGRHPAELLTDWLIMSPAGSITPREFTAARRLRANHDEIRDQLARQRSASSEHEA